MTDFNYGEFSTDVLIDALKSEKSYIRLLQSDCKHFARKIERRRGYSQKTLEAYAQTIQIKQRLIANAQKEVAELESVIAQRAEAAFAKRRTKMVWKEVLVHWCHARRWVVRGIFDDGSSDYLDDFANQADAIEEAKIYAFDTSCGPERAWRVKVFTKNDTIKKVIEVA